MNLKYIPTKKLKEIIEAHDKGINIGEYEDKYVDRIDEIRKILSERENNYSKEDQTKMDIIDYMGDVPIFEKKDGFYYGDEFIGDIFALQIFRGKKL